MPAIRKPWRQPPGGGYRATDSRPEPTTPPVGPAGTSTSCRCCHHSQTAKAEQPANASWVTFEDQGISGRTVGMIIAALILGVGVIVTTVGLLVG